ATFTHSYPHCWRCRRPVIFRATDQWFMIIDHVPPPLRAPEAAARAHASAGGTPAVATARAPLSHRERALELIATAVRWDPPPSRTGIREAVRARPDWCLSRQRSWGVGIPAVYCERCDTATLDPRVARRAAERTRARDSDVWYEAPVEEFLPP